MRDDINETGPLGKVLNYVLGGKLSPEEEDLVTRAAQAHRLYPDDAMNAMIAIAVRGHATLLQGVSELKALINQFRQMIDQSPGVAMRLSPLQALGGAFIFLTILFGVGACERSRGRAEGEAKADAAALRAANDFRFSGEMETLFRAQRAGDLKMILECSGGENWQVRDGVCFPFANNDKRVRGWRHFGPSPGPKSP